MSGTLAGVTSLDAARRDQTRMKASFIVLLLSSKWICAFRSIAGAKL
jgi:hypothetical protein